MSDIKLFSIVSQAALELEARTAVLEKDLQKHVEQHMEVLLGVLFWLLNTAPEKPTKAVLIL